MNEHFVLLLLVYKCRWRYGGDGGRSCRGHGGQEGWGRRGHGGQDGWGCGGKGGAKCVLRRRANLSVGGGGGTHYRGQGSGGRIGRGDSGSKLRGRETLGEGGSRTAPSCRVGGRGRRRRRGRGGGGRVSSAGGVTEWGVRLGLRLRGLDHAPTSPHHHLVELSYVPGQSLEGGSLLGVQLPAPADDAAIHTLLTV